MDRDGGNGGYPDVTGDDFLTRGEFESKIDAFGRAMDHKFAETRFMLPPVVYVVASVLFVLLTVGLLIALCVRASNLSDVADEITKAMPDIEMALSMLVEAQASRRSPAMRSDDKGIGAERLRAVLERFGPENGG